MNPCTTCHNLRDNKEQFTRTEQGGKYCLDGDGQYPGMPRADSRGRYECRAESPRLADDHYGNFPVLRDLYGCGRWAPMPESPNPLLTGLPEGTVLL